MEELTKEQVRKLVDANILVIEESYENLSINVSLKMKHYFKFEDKYFISDEFGIKIHESIILEVADEEEFSYNFQLKKEINDILTK